MAHFRRTPSSGARPAIDKNQLFEVPKPIRDPRIDLAELVPASEVAAIKAEKAFAAFALVRMSRLSVMPVSDDEWARIEKMSLGER